MTPQQFTPEQNEAEARRIIAERTPELLAWLESEGLTIEDLRDSHYGQLQVRWKAHGRLRALRAWYGAARAGMVAAKVTGRPKVAAKIATRFADAQMEHNADLIRPLAADAEDLSDWPAEIAWAFRHPLLHFDPGGKLSCCEKCHRPLTNPVMRAMVVEYERENKAPNEAALTLLRRCVDNPKLVDELLKAQFKPQKGAKPEGDDPKDAAEAERVGGLHAALAEIRQKSAKIIA